ncbi:hypothetical protein AKO1_009094 [Acrasis kona]|uniref:Calcium-transporting ATPase n=1 Tax=Acrasis kona TaxID=1008807 RepID=A0AAW2ZJS8_9EUKA
MEITVERLVDLNTHRDHEKLKGIGGITEVARMLGANLKDGLDDKNKEFEDRKREFGENIYPEPELKNLFYFIQDALKDDTLRILIICALVSLLFGVIVIREPYGWLDSAGIFFAVFLVVTVSSFNNYSKERQFRALNRIKENRDVKVIRCGTQIILPSSAIVVGDIIRLEAGDHVPADGLVVEAFNMTCDESNLTGETESEPKDTSNNVFLISGSQLTDGVGTMLVTAVGINTGIGQALLKIQEEDNQQTPLEKSLERVADAIGHCGLTVSVLMFFLLLSKRFFTIFFDPNGKWSLEFLAAVLRDLVLSVSLVVAAVPEGLPLAVTISLAYSTKKMLRDNNLVRNISACETMGSATTICSDKTGTLTTNRMTVSEAWICGANYKILKKRPSIREQCMDILCDAIAINSTANILQQEEARPIYMGNPTECAMLMMLDKNFGTSYQDLRDSKKSQIAQIFTFSSERKCMSTILHSTTLPSTSFRIYTKGASEIVFNLCDRYLDGSANVQKIDDQLKQYVHDEIHRMAASGLRTICIAYNDFKSNDITQTCAQDLENQLICLAIIGIKDPLRGEVPDAIQRCIKAGIIVRMVTGDNLLTAKQIAIECGIYDPDVGIAMEGKDFRVLPPSEMIKVVPKLQVLARSTPIDKHLLVTTLKTMGQIVAVTGDGTNDAAALKASNVGLSMGKSGTEVAKEASDIIIMDDNFTSIVKSVLWGRSVYENVRKFLQFQMTINIAAVLITFIGSVFENGFPLTAVQLLWINLIMDTFAALALSTEPPTEQLLDRNPHGMDEPIVNNNMWKNIIVQSLLQLCILLPLINYHEYFFGPIGDPILSSKMFLIIFASCTCIQVLIVEFGGYFGFGTHGLTMQEWITTIPVGFILRFVPVPKHLFFGYDVRAEYFDIIYWIKVLLAKNTFHPDSPTTQFWKYATMLCWFHVLFVVPFKTGILSTRPNHFLSVCDFVVDFVLLVHTIFLASRFQHHHGGELVTDYNELKRKYRENDFVVDLIYSIPIDSMFTAYRTLFGADGRAHLLMELLRLPRLIMLMRPLQLLNRTAVRISSIINPAYIHMASMLLLIGLVTHWVACAWVLLSQVQGYGTNEFIISQEWSDSSPLEIYGYALFWSLYKMTGGNVGGTPTNRAERSFEIFMSFAGLTIYASIIGSLSNLVMDLAEDQNHIQEKMEKVNAFLRRKKMPNKLQNRIRSLMEYKLHHSDDAEREIINDLPDSLKTDIVLHSHKSLISSVPFLQRCNEKFISEVILKLIPLVYGPEEVIFNYNEFGTSMFFIIKGDVEIHLPSDPPKIIDLHTGDFFGEVALLDSKYKRSGSARTTSFCEILELTKEDLDSIIEDYGDKTFFEDLDKVLIERKIQRPNGALARQIHKETSPVTPKDVINKKVEMLTPIITKLNQDVSVPKIRTPVSDKTPTTLRRPMLKRENSSSGLIPPALKRENSSSFLSIVTEAQRRQQRTRSMDSSPTGSSDVQSSSNNVPLSDHVENLQRQLNQALSDLSVARDQILKFTYPEQKNDQIQNELNETRNELRIVKNEMMNFELKSKSDERMIHCYQEELRVGQRKLELTEMELNQVMTDLSDARRNAKEAWSETSVRIRDTEHISLAVNDIQLQLEKLERETISKDDRIHHLESKLHVEEQEKKLKVHVARHLRHKVSELRMLQSEIKNDSIEMMSSIKNDLTVLSKSGFGTLLDNVLKKI